MAGHFRKWFNYTTLLIYVLFCVKFVQSFGALAPGKPGEDEVKHSQTFRAVSEAVTTPPPPPPQVRLHPGVVVSVIIVTAAAIIAALFIVRKYCFPQSDATYRYSALRQLEESNNTAADREDSDEDLLE